MITTYIYIVSPISIANDFEYERLLELIVPFDVFSTRRWFLAPRHLFPASGYIWHLTMQATNLMAGSYGWDSLKMLYVKK